MAEPYIRLQDPFFLALLSGVSQAMIPPGKDHAPTDFTIENLEKIRTREKLWSLFESMPKEAEPEIQLFFDHLLKTALPAQRKALQKIAATLPRDPGGRPPKRLSEEVCSRICNKVSDLHRYGVTMLDAQQRAADDEGLSLRRIQRIWSKRKENN